MEAPYNTAVSHGIQRAWPMDGEDPLTVREPESLTKGIRHVLFSTA